LEGIFPFMAKKKDEIQILKMGLAILFRVLGIVGGVIVHI